MLASALSSTGRRMASTVQGCGRRFGSTLQSPFASVSDLQDSSTIVLDCAAPPLFERAHVQGARQFPFSALKSSGSKHVVSKGEIEAIVAQMGIRSDSQVIVYDDAGGVAAARVWWVLSFYGFPSVRVLSSGWRGLVPAGAPLETGMPAWDAIQASDPGFFQAAPRPDMLATADQAFEASTDDSTQLLDVRTVGEFVGVDSRGNHRTGHIPTAINLPHAALTDEGAFSTVETAKTAFAEAGLDPAKRVITYCQSGARAAHTALMLRAAGFDKVANFDGSMSVYANDTEHKLALPADRA